LNGWHGNRHGFIIQNHLPTQLTLCEYSVWEWWRFVMEFTRGTFYWKHFSLDKSAERKCWLNRNNGSEVRTCWFTDLGQ
jgi:hypothetical protein